MTVGRFPVFFSVCVRETVQTLLAEGGGGGGGGGRSRGHLPPSEQLLLPQLSPLSFPGHFAPVAKVLRLLREVEHAAEFR